jgi:hypothetical protein
LSTNSFTPAIFFLFGPRILILKYLFLYILLAYMPFQNQWTTTTWTWSTKEGNQFSESSTWFTKWQTVTKHDRSYNSWIPRRLVIYPKPFNSIWNYKFVATRSYPPYIQKEVCWICQCFLSQWLNA